MLIALYSLLPRRQSATINEQAKKERNRPWIGQLQLESQTSPEMFLGDANTYSNLAPAHLSFPTMANRILTPSPAQPLLANALRPQYPFQQDSHIPLISKSALALSSL